MTNEQHDPLRDAMARVRGTHAAPPRTPSAHAGSTPSGDSRRSIRQRLADGFASVEEPAAAVWPWPVAGLLAGVWAAAMSLVALAFVVLVAWIFAPLGSGQFGDVVRAASSIWLLADGGALQWQGATVSLTPLVLTFGVLLFQRRAGRWLVSAVAAETPLAALPTYAFAIAASVSVHLLVANAATQPRLQFPVAHNVLGATLVAAIGFAWGVQRELGVDWPEPIPMLASTLRAYVGTIAAVGTGVVMLLAVAQRGAFMDVLTAVAGDGVSKLQLLLLCLVFLPTVVLWVVAVLIGAPITIGVGTTVSLQALHVGALPPLPLFALLPDRMPASAAWLHALSLLGVAVLVRRLRATRDLRVRAAQCALIVVAGAMCALPVIGGIGPGRLVSTGPELVRFLEFWTLWPVGALLADEALYRLRRYRAARPVAEAEDAATAVPAAEAQPLAD